MKSLLMRNIVINDHKEAYMYFAELHVYWEVLETGFSQTSLCLRGFVKMFLYILIPISINEEVM